MLVPKHNAAGVTYTGGFLVRVSDTYAGTHGMIRAMCTGVRSGAACSRNGEACLSVRPHNAWRLHATANR
jgi:hypothetical protein